MSVWFTSDLHLGNPLNGKMGEGRTKLGCTADEAGWNLTETINEMVPKRAKLFILGDAIDSSQGIKWAKCIRCQNIEIILGNHDKLRLSEYFAMGWKVHGFRKYRTFWLSHCPIHPHEIRNMDLNIHGHVHIFGDTPRIEDPRYFCVNPEFHDFKPVSIETIDKYVENLKKQLDKK